MTRLMIVTRSFTKLHKAHLASRKIKKDEKKVAVKADKKKVIKAEAKSTGKAGSKLLELGLLCDCTGSMEEWIERAKKTLKQIIESTVKSCDGRLSFGQSGLPACRRVTRPTLACR